MYDNYVTRLHGDNANDDVHINIFLFQRNALAATQRGLTCPIPRQCSEYVNPQMLIPFFCWRARYFTCSFIKFS